MNIKALQLASRFSLPPNSLGYCGENTAPAKLIKCVVKGECDDIKNEFSRFIVLNPYLETIKTITGLDKFSYRNIEAYWLGNDELKKARPKHYELLLDNFAKQGVPDWLIAELKKNTPKKFLPFHLFQVLHIGVGRASGSVPYNIETINNCMIRWGKIENINKVNLTINLNSLALKNKHHKALKAGLNNKFEILTFKEKHSYSVDFLPSIKVGDTVAVHWKQVVKILTPKEGENLEYWTKQTVAD